MDAAGNLYGTATVGTAGSGSAGGTVFRLSKSGKFKVLYSFTSSVDGNRPYASLIQDSAGNLYGTTYSGGLYNTGVVFKVDKFGTETILHNFENGHPGCAYPYGSLVRDADGNLYGTTSLGGIHHAGCVFKLYLTRKLIRLHEFTGISGQGGYPYAGLLRDSSGNLYGTTTTEVAFKIDINGTYTVIPGEAQSYGTLIQDSAGNIYGTNVATFRFGSVFKINTSGVYSTLYSFMGPPDGEVPYGGLVQDGAGNLYRTTYHGGNTNYGTSLFQSTDEPEGRRKNGSRGWFLSG